MKPRSIAVLSLLLSTTLGLVALLPTLALAHERKEVAGLMVIFGAEPEPALTGEVQQLVWRFRGLESSEPFTDIEELSAVITRDGAEYGPFTARMSRRDPGTVQTKHIFTVAGEYEVMLTFKKKDDPQTHSVSFTYRIGDRKELEIPGS